MKYPTDSGLLASAVVKIGRVVRRIKAAAAASRTRFRDRGRAGARRVRRIASTLRLRGAEARQETQATVFRITGELAALVDRAATETTAVARNARRFLRALHINGRARGRLVRAVNELDTLLVRAARLTAQARVRLGGGKPDSATRLVSLHDPQARPIRKGRIDRPVEFGY
ncbi:transposase [Rugosimonospora africana]|uniref:Transposase n=1 Tax=Rugosimonospora africana TaxID=556532 RepID=A0A8J3QWY1_9ACTN|nr:transposase [Rugosimonospora africana]